MAQNTTITVNIDLGVEDGQLPWNTLSNQQNGQIDNLFAMNGFETEIDLEVSDDFRGMNTNGTTEADPALDFPSFASGDSFFGNTLEWNDGIQETAGVTISDLNPSISYDLDLFASRSASDNRETQYHIIAGNVDTMLFLNASSNLNGVAALQNILPTSDGKIVIDLSAGQNNDNEFGFYYLGIIRLQYEDMVEIVEPQLSLASPTGGEYYQTGKTPQIRWESQGILESILEFSEDDGNSWTAIDTVSALAQEYDWTIPNLNSENCLVRIRADTIVKTSNENFTINNVDTTSCHVVVLGSSTAAGTGPTSLDSAWVWLYRDTIFQNDTRFTVTNLARGGFTTYNILPTGSSIATGINQTIDIERNITEALSLNPNAVIINLPSNDAANSYSVEDQLANYDLILEELDVLEIPYWIATPQPRNGFSDDQKQIQLDMRNSTFARFGQFAIDFWNELEDGDSNVDSSFDSGDGVHLNNAGHRLLLERVLQSQIPNFLLDLKNGGVSTKQIDNHNSLVVYPNPTTDFIKIQNLEPPFSVQVYDVNGKLLIQHDRYFSDTLVLPVSGLQFVKIIKEDEALGRWVVKR